MYDGAVEAVVLRLIELGVAPSHTVVDTLEVLVLRAKMYGRRT